MKKIKGILVEVKKTVRQTIEIIPDNGYDMPKTAKELIEINREIENNPSQFIDDNEWLSGSIEIEEVIFEELD